MFGCLHGKSDRLAELAEHFSPLIEKTSADTVVFSLAGLERLFGDVYQLASEISRRGEAMKIEAHFAIAHNPDTAILAARTMRGVTIILPGHETEVLSDLPVDTLSAEPTLVDTLHAWGVHTLGELIALPEMGVAERLGDAGVAMLRLASGRASRPLRVETPPEIYTARQALDHPVALLEPLLFVISSMLHDLTARLERQALATNKVVLRFVLDRRRELTREVEFPVALRDAKVLLKNVQLHLEAHPAGSAIHAVEVTLVPAEPRVRQSGLFVPATPEPEKLHTLIARLGALVGEQRVGSPEVLDTHRPDAYRMRACSFEAVMASAETGGSPPLRLAFRYFRPVIEAQVETRGGEPRRIEAARVSGAVLQAAGPWRTSGEWWTETAWDRAEWDIALESGGLYRIYLASRRWFVEGSYD